MRGTTNRNARGSTRDRAARKRWLIRMFEADKYVTIPVPSTGTAIGSFRLELACRCYRCGSLLTADTLTVDRIIPGCKGGTYRRNNIRPACAACNSETGGACRA